MGAKEALRPAAPSRGDIAFAVLVAASIATGLFALQGHVGLNLGDEGYLWYGVAHVRQGEIPLLDFEAYDPGRYYAMALLSFVFGTDVVGCRAGIAVIQTIGLAFGILAARRVTANRGWLALVAVLLALWMLPRNKSFDTALPILAVWVGMRVLEAPTARVQWATGIFIGIAAVFGRNHGVYSLAALVPLVAWSSRGSATALGGSLLRVGAGIVVGYSPIFALALAEPAFAGAFWQDVLQVARRGVSIPVPIPWPWRLRGQGDAGVRFFDAARSAAYLAYFAFFPIAIWTAVRGASPVARSPLLIASLAVGLVYIQRNAVRSDFEHFAQSVHPVLLGVVALIAATAARGRVVGRALAVAGLAAATLFVAGRRQPFVEALLDPAGFVPRIIAGKSLSVPRATARLIDAVRSEMVPDLGTEEAIFFAPYLATLYPVIERPSPVWSILPIWPVPDAKQIEMIGELERSNTRWAVVDRMGLDNREDWQFEDTHPRVWAYLREAFEPVSSAAPARYRVLRRRGDR
jgi:hypothetical protein